MTGFRLRPGSGAPVPFRWNGREMTGREGDTLAAALMAQGVRLVGRSFKYHRPRGIMSAGEEEAGALVTVGEGARRTPNLKAPMVELEPGLVAASQNHWPSLAFDAGRVNDLLGRFLTAGFYYKTFMGPFEGTRVWMGFEHLIRRAAGLGAATTEPDPDLYEQVHDHCDLLVAGAGPAGLAAALEAAEQGADVILAEQDFRIGGALLADPDGAATLAELAGAVAAHDNIRLLTRAQVFGLYDHGVAGVVERLPAGAPVRERLRLVRTRAIVAATGAIERGLVFGDNDLPGVMGAAAAATYAVRFGVAPGRRIVVATGNDSAYAAAASLALAGLDVTLLDLRDRAPEAAGRIAAAAGVAIRPGMAPIRALGGGLSGGLRAVLCGRHRGEGRALPEEKLSADVLAVSGGWSPALHLTSHARARPVWSDDLLCFLPGEGEVIAAGAAAGVWGTEDCLTSGRAAGRRAAIAARTTRRRPLKDAEPGGWETPPAPVWEVSARGRTDRKFVDPMHDVTAADIRQAHREGFEAPEHMKRYTTLGMATDQGKAGGVAGLALLAEARGEAGPGALSPTTFRPPYAPVSMGVFAGEIDGTTWAPFRPTPFHAKAEAAGAVFVDAGHWRRPWFFPAPGEDLRAASMREAATVRASVGLCDISTLGKFMVQGPEAAGFLDAMFSNRVSTLPIGKARYGFLLREDGIVFDDGTVWRLSETAFLVTTTTGHAEAAEAHFARWKARLGPFRAAVTPVTEGWCALALAGPRARAALGRVTEDDVSPAALPFLGVREMTVAGLPARVARLGFSGELAYEVHVRPADAPALWDALAEAAGAEGGGLYGLEALDILRVEKGFLTGREIDGRATLADLGAAGMASREKPFLGRALMGREALADPARPRLVGLIATDRGAGLRAGALLHRLGEETGRGIGWIASIADSPAMGARIALGFAEGGVEALEGATLMAHDPTAGAVTKVKVRASCFVDPGGSRMKDDPEGSRMKHGGSADD
ncbi:MAG: 2Fe-2S iron-sulfur cluster-binding protein [Pseudomonadota bacterium]|nr:2Fe-2S iron-sulfur cluster-binding protein [Pseudomonadota bacterium]